MPSYAVKRAKAKPHFILESVDPEVVISLDPLDVEALLAEDLADASHEKGRRRIGVVRELPTAAGAGVTKGERV